MFDAAIAITVVQSAQTVDEDKLRTVFAQREPLFRYLRIGTYHLVVVILEGLVGSGIERVLDMLAELGVLEIVGVAQQDGPFTLRVVGLQMTQATVRQILPSLS